MMNNPLISSVLYLSGVDMNYSAAAMKTTHYPLHVSSVDMYNKGPATLQPVCYTLNVSSLDMNSSVAAMKRGLYPLHVSGVDMYDNSPAINTVLYPLNVSGVDMNSSPATVQTALHPFRIPWDFDCLSVSLMATKCEHGECIPLDILYESLFFSGQSNGLYSTTKTVEQLQVVVDTAVMDGCDSDEERNWYWNDLDTMGHLYARHRLLVHLLLNTNMVCRKMNHVEGHRKVAIPYRT